MSLSINGQGTITIQGFKTDNLNIQPESEKNNILSKITERIIGIRLDPPKDKSGKSVSVKKWRNTFKVVKWENKIILTRN